MENKETAQLKNEITTALYGMTVLLAQMDADIQKLRKQIPELRIDVEALVRVTRGEHQLEEYREARKAAADYHHIPETQSGELSRVSELLQYIERMHPEPEKLRGRFPSK